MLMTTTHTSAKKLSSTFGAHAAQSYSTRLCGKLVGMHLTAAVAVAWRLALLARNIDVLRAPPSCFSTTTGTDNERVHLLWGRGKERERAGLCKNGGIKAGGAQEAGAAEDHPSPVSSDRK
jgi:hypothetical protein